MLASRGQIERPQKRPGGGGDTNATGLGQELRRYFRLITCLITQKESWTNIEWVALGRHPQLPAATRREDEGRVLTRSGRTMSPSNHRFDRRNLENVSSLETRE